HPVERLPVADADLWLKPFESGDAAQFFQQCFDALRRSRDEKIDALAAEQDGSFQRPPAPRTDQLLSQALATGEFGKAVGGEICDGGHGGKTARSPQPCQCGNRCSPDFNAVRPSSQSPKQPTPQRRRRRCRAPISDRVPPTAAIAAGTPT